MLCRVLCCMHVVLTAHSLRRNCPISSAQWMGSGYAQAWIHPQKGERKPSYYHTLRSIVQVLIFDIALNLLTLHAPQWNNPKKYCITVKADTTMLDLWTSNLINTNHKIKEIVIRWKSCCVTFFEESTFIWYLSEWLTSHVHETF